MQDHTLALAVPKVTAVQDGHLKTQLKTILNYVVVFIFKNLIFYLHNAIILF